MEQREYHEGSYHGVKSNSRTPCQDCPAPTLAKRIRAILGPEPVEALRPPTTSPPSEDSPHLTVAELAKRWKTTPNGIRIRRHRGRAPKGFKSGVQVLFPLTEVEEWEAQRMAEDVPSHRYERAEHRPPEPLR